MSKTNAPIFDLILSISQKISSI